jgi:hypothetical protein
MRRGYRGYVVILGLWLAGCDKNSEACEKARLEASDVWKDVQEKAGKWKLQGTTGYEEFNPQQKADHYRVWNGIETSAESIWKAFAFEKITWSSARPARDTATKEFKSYFAADKYTSFQALLDGANRHFDAVSAACK